ncbi:MAG TPA: glycosyltransferase family 2 protein [Cytophagaceae bacterium]|jgi:glycosyltransferase involved in cell wall biosynthesis|nr:glycosyltransferase family 2 protein [Cytophagaceae bacterium]
MSEISTVIITNNEASNIERVLLSVLKISSDIIIVDSGSTDNTLEICKKFPVRVYQHQWEGYAAQKNYGNSLTKNECILSIDADEELSEELVMEIKKVFQNPQADCYDLPRRANFCGQWISFGHWNPESHIRIFKKSQVSWNTDAVHEFLLIPEKLKIKKLKGQINHYTIRSLEQYRQKNDHYINLAAKKMKLAHKKAGFIKLYLSPAYRFIHSYILKLGFLDGYFGYVIARETARVAYLKYAKIKDVKDPIENS